MADANPQDKSKRLGRGLEALIGIASQPDAAATPLNDRLRDIPLDRIQANPLQPRRAFDDADLRELEDSMRANGLLQPVTVRAADSTGNYELIAGGRRLRAARRLGWPTIPAVVRETPDEKLLTLALVENLQREDLNPLDEAEGYRQLTEEFGLSQQQVAESVGRNRSTVANSMRLLSLPDEVQLLIRSNQLTAGHARALLALPPGSSIVDVARKVAREQHSVREVERMVQGQKRTRQGADKAALPQTESPEVRRITDRLRRYLQTDVQIVADERARGEIRIRFYSADDLERLLELIAGPDESLS